MLEQFLCHAPCPVNRNGKSYGRILCSSKATLLRCPKSSHAWLQKERLEEYHLAKVGKELQTRLHSEWRRMTGEKEGNLSILTVYSSVIRIGTQLCVNRNNSGIFIVSSHGNGWIGILSFSESGQRPESWFLSHPELHLYFTPQKHKGQTPLVLVTLHLLIASLSCQSWCQCSLIASNNLVRLKIWEKWTSAWWELPQISLINSDHPGTLLVCFQYLSVPAKWKGEELIIQQPANRGRCFSSQVPPYFSP